MSRLKFAYGKCHALTAALLDFCPAGECMGLFIEGSCIHSAFRVPHSTVYLDAFGAELDLTTKAARYVRPGEQAEFRSLTETELRRMVPGDRARSILSARTLARELLAEADRLEAAPSPA